ncbi:MAG TPA: ankyrin repeat domain-containing protein, partial [Candidatus Goldiibacteriota bacterium]|nr:ankyrin repeat domain-containing protein [Candidatus Goldiibacteriota bacterium]
MQQTTFLNNEFASAFKDGDFERAHKLVKAGADMHNTIIHLDDGHSYRVMEYAVANGLFDHIKALINMGYNINDRDDTGKTAVFIAINNIDNSVLTEVLKYKPDLNLRYKDMGGYYATGRLFHKAENTTVLMQACYISGLRTIKKLLNRGADAN